MLILPDSYIMQHGKKLYHLNKNDPVERITFEYQSSYMSETNQLMIFKKQIQIEKNGNILCIKKCTNKTTGTENSDYEESKIEEESVLKIFSLIYEFLNRGGLELCDLPLIGGDSVSCELEFSSKQKISVPGGITFKGLFDESLWSFIMDNIEPLLQSDGIDFKLPRELLFIS